MRRPSLARTLVEGAAFAVGAVVVTGALFVSVGILSGLAVLSVHRGTVSP